MCQTSLASEQNGEISSINRTDFGKSPFSIWSPLTSFERRTIAGFPSEHERDPAKLLALYLVASGELRTQAEFDAINAHLDQWLKANLMDYNDSVSRYETGKKLLELMHESFFIPNSEAKPIGSYDFDQSQLTAIFETKTYNCISSSLLYIVLASKLGLNAQAVLIPSHVFVQLDLDQGPVEVETTSAQGFNVLHDEEYYLKNSAQWLSDRQLPATTYDDYLNRRILSPAEIGTENMWSQHTKTERMRYQDRMRLAEIKSYLEPDNYLAHKNRLNYYSSEFNYLQNRQDADTLAFLFNHVDPYINTLSKIATKPDAKADLDFQNLLAWTYSNRAYSFVTSIDPDKGLRLARDYLHRLQENIPDRAEIESNLYLSIGIYAEHTVKEEEFLKGRAAFAGIEQECANHSSCVIGLSKFYSALARNYWDLKNWEKSIETYTEFLSLNSIGKNEENFIINAESAYLNLSNEFLLDEDWDMAIANLETCLLQLPNPERCKENLAEIEQAILSMEQ